MPSFSSDHIVLVCLFKNLKPLPLKMTKFKIGLHISTATPPWHMAKAGVKILVGWVTTGVGSCFAVCVLCVLLCFP